MEFGYMAIPWSDNGCNRYRLQTLRETKKRSPPASKDL
jgi:hypothetical protein